MSIANSNVEVFEVAKEILDKYLERNKQYLDTWKQHGVRDTQSHIDSKASRLKQALYMHEQGGRALNEGDIDDAIDLAIYSIFHILHIRAGSVPEFKELVLPPHLRGSEDTDEMPELPRLDVEEKG